MILNIYVLARIYVVEQVRRQVPTLTMFLAVVLLALPTYVNNFTLGLSSFERVAQDFGLTLISLYGVTMAIYLGSTAVPSDAERRTLYPLLARPLPRLVYLLGKLAGVSAVLVTSITFLSFCLMLAIAALAHTGDPRVLLVGFCFALEAVVLAAACLFFSTFASPPLAGVLGIFIYFVGGLSPSFINFFLVEDRGAEGMAVFARGLKMLLPHFDWFSVKNSVVYALEIPSPFLVSLVVYAALWVSLYLLLAELVFARRDL